MSKFVPTQEQADAIARAKLFNRQDLTRLGKLAFSDNRVVAFFAGWFIAIIAYVEWLAKELWASRVLLSPAYHRRMRQLRAELEKERESW